MSGTSKNSDAGCHFAPPAGRRLAASASSRPDSLFVVYHAASASPLGQMHRAVSWFHALNSGPQLFGAMVGRVRRFVKLTKYGWFGSGPFRGAGPWRTSRRQSGVSTGSGRVAGIAPIATRKPTTRQASSGRKPWRFDERQ
jgi:hypothetical protein